MSLLENILDFNRTFVNDHMYEQYETSKRPDKKAVPFTCMDTRLQELATKALGFNNGDLKIVKNAGATITHPYGSTMRSLLIAIYALGAEEIIIMGHRDCGMGQLNVDEVLERMSQRGVNDRTLSILANSGLDIRKFLQGFTDVYENVKDNVDKVINHPLFDKSVPVHGLIIDPRTGELELVHDGYKNTTSQN